MQPSVPGAAIPAYLRTHVLRGESLVVNLPEQLVDLQSLQPERGHRGIALVKDGPLHVVLEVMRAGSRLGEHEAPGPISLYVLEGRVRIVRPDGETSVTAGELAAVAAHVRHDVVADDESSFLLTVAYEAGAWPVAHGHAHSQAELERATSRLAEIVRRIDPKVESTIGHYRWNEDDVLDVDLRKDGAEIRLEVSCDRALGQPLTPPGLEHDLEEAIHDLKRRASRG